MLVLMSIAGEVSSVFAERYEYNQPRVIEAIQKRLTKLGFDPGPEDGRWAKKTRRAFEDFCASRGLVVGERLSREHIRELWELIWIPKLRAGMSCDGY